MIGSRGRDAMLFNVLWWLTLICFLTGTFVQAQEQMDSIILSGIRPSETACKY